MNEIDRLGLLITNSSINLIIGLPLLSAFGLVKIIYESFINFKDFNNSKN